MSWSRVEVLEPPADFFVLVDLPADDFEPADFEAVDFESPDFESLDLELDDFELADFELSDLLPTDLGSDFAAVEAFLPAARAAAVVSAAVFLVADAFDGVDFAAALVVVPFEEALFSVAPDFILEEVSLVLLFVVAMVSVV